jgi:hypothetical protein
MIYDRRVDHKLDLQVKGNYNIIKRSALYLRSKYQIRRICLDSTDISERETWSMIQRIQAPGNSVTRLRGQADVPFQDLIIFSSFYEGFCCRHIFSIQSRDRIFPSSS